MVGNGLSSNDISDINLEKSITVALHAKPIKNLRIGLSYYWDKIVDNKVGDHSGHATTAHAVQYALYQEDVLFEVFSFSLAYFGEKWEFLNETCYNNSFTDSLGAAHNFSSFTYVGKRLKERNVLYGLFDYINVANNDLHILPCNLTKFGLGIKREFNYLTNMQIQVERWTGISGASVTPVPNKFQVSFQLAYGLNFSQ